MAQWQKNDVKVTSENDESKVVLVTYYWDGTGKDNRNKHMMDNVYMGVSSVNAQTRQKWSSKRLIAILPHSEVNVLNIPDNVTAHAWNEEVKQFRRQLYQYALRWMLEPVCYHQHWGFDFKQLDDGPIINVVPRVWNLSADIPEG